MESSVRNSGLGFSLVKKLIDGLGESVSAFEATIDMHNIAAYNTRTPLAKQYSANISQKAFFTKRFCW